ncbi:hypothetical protein SAMN04488066_11098 [Halorubrum aquaticum]|uniref:Uncharacterized protein n=1 Tax=Halorubrum aquaticum TaxID=387340 RepID=A0A1I3B9C1_9EURY|nr:hypothetical protein [Halorubrum aquaticum]SFH58770.1 hypothetical protein SAMN04488066_11098 [Halorubrum aquaticum]
MASPISVPRRALGAVQIGIATLLLSQPLALRSVTVGAGTPTLAEPGTLVALAPPALVAAGAVTFLSGLAAVRGRTLSPRASLATPVVCVAAGVALGVDVGPEAVSAASLSVSGVTPFVVAGATIGGSLAPVVLGATREDTVALLAGAVLLLVGIGLAPAPTLALVAGLLGGGVAIGALWTLDAESWRP